MARTSIYIAIAALGGVLGLLWLLGPVLAPFLAAALFAYILDPAVEALVKRRVSRTLATLMMVLVGLVSLLVFALILVPIIQQEYLLLRDRLPTLISDFATRMAPVLRDLGWKGPVNGLALKNWLTQQLAGYREDIVTALFESVKASGSVLMSLLANALLIPIVSFYLLLDWPNIVRGVKHSVPRRWLEPTLDIVTEIDTLLSQFFRGQILLMLSLAIFYATALSLTGLELAIPIGILTGLLVFVPYVGFALGFVLATLAAVFQFTSLWPVVSVVAVFGLGQIIESIWLTPRLIGDRIGLHPVVVIFALMAFGEVFGFFGILAALPVSAALAVGIRRVASAYLRSPWYLEDQPSSTRDPQ